METTAHGKTASISGVTEAALSKPASGAHAAVNSIAGAADEMTRKARPAIDQVATMAHQAVDRAAGAAAPTAEWLAEQGDCLYAMQKSLIGDTRSFVSSNPLKAVGIAVVAGFLLSRIIR